MFSSVEDLEDYVNEEGAKCLKDVKEMYEKN